MFRFTLKLGICTGTVDNPTSKKNTMWIRIGFNADPDQALSPIGQLGSDPEFWWPKIYKFRDEKNYNLFIYEGR